MPDQAGRKKEGRPSIFCRLGLPFLTGNNASYESFEEILDLLLGHGKEQGELVHPLGYPQQPALEDMADAFDAAVLFGEHQRLLYIEAALFYGTLVDQVVRTSSPRQAEMAKLIENTFRQVNIALVNEMAIFCDELGVNLWESIEAAATVEPVQ